MRRLAIAILFSVAALGLLGMGGLGGGPEGTVPQTSEDIRARLFDRGGIMAEVTQFSMEGRVSLSGGMGSGTMTVPFEKLKRVDFGEVAGEKVAADLQLRTGEALRLQVKKRAVFYGSTGFGAYQIRAGDLKRIEFP